MTQSIQQQSSPSQRINVGSNERRLSTVIGGTMALIGLTRIKHVSGLAMLGLGAALVHRGMTGHCHGYSMLGINTANTEADRAGATPQDYFNNSIHIEHAVTINKSPAELFSFWRDFTNLPRIMSHLDSVTLLDDRRTHWARKDRPARTLNGTPRSSMKNRMRSSPGDRSAARKSTTRGACGSSLPTVVRRK